MLRKFNVASGSGFSHSILGVSSTSRHAMLTYWNGIGLESTCHACQTPFHSSTICDMGSPCVATCLSSREEIPWKIFCPPVPSCTDSSRDPLQCYTQWRIFPQASYTHKIPCTLLDNGFTNSKIPLSPLWTTNQGWQWCPWFQTWVFILQKV